MNTGKLVDVFFGDYYDEENLKKDAIAKINYYQDKGYYVDFEIIPHMTDKFLKFYLVVKAREQK